jgi:uncharacterized protein (DUF983 family)
MDTLPERPDGVERWPPPYAITKPAWGQADWPVTIWRGMAGQCPHCGKGKIFDGYLKVYPVCTRCSAPLGAMPADDAPPYVAMLLVLHVIGILVVVFYKGIVHPSPVLMGFLLLVVTGVCMGALRIAKGAIIGILLKLGFNQEVLNG